MSTIVTRSVKGSPLTHNEVDANFNNLNTDKYQSGSNVSFGTLAATGVSTFSAGTAAAPAITTTGDTNTGIFFPAADTIAFGEGGTEVIRIHPSGGVSIGSTTDPAQTSLTVTGSPSTSVEGVFTNTNTGTLASAGVRGVGDSTGFFALRQYGTGVTATAFGLTLANYALLFSSGASSNGLALGSLTADPVIIGTNNLERMRIDSSGNLLVGGTSALNSGTGRGDIEINGSSAAILSHNIGGAIAGYLFHDGTDYQLNNNINNTGKISFFTKVGGSGTAKMQIANSGGVSIGNTTDPGATNLSVTGSSTSASFIPSAATVPTNGLYLPTTNTVGFSTATTERIRITSGGVVLINTSTTTNNIRLNQRLALVQAGTSSYGGMAITNYGNSNADIQGLIDFNRSRGTTDGTMTVVNSGDALGAISFRGSDGTNFINAAQIKVEVDGTPGTNDMPGRLVFFTTPDGSSTLTERMRIDSSGNVGIGTTSPTEKFYVVGNAVIANPSNTQTTLFVLNSTSYNSAALTNFVIGSSNSDSVNAGATYQYNIGLDGTATGKGLTFSSVSSLGTAERMRLPRNGGVQAVTCVSVGNATPSASGAGITFPATQSASTDANTLDDYEEGTFTPTISGSTTAGTGTYTAQFGVYTKVGSVVTVQVNLGISNHTGTGNILLSGLPFTSFATTDYWGSVSIGYVNNLALTASNFPTGLVTVNATNVALYQSPTGGGAASSVPMDTSFSIIYTATYRTT